VGSADSKVCSAFQGRRLCSWLFHHLLTEWSLPRLRVNLSPSFFFICSIGLMVVVVVVLAHFFFPLAWNIFRSDSGVVNLYDLTAIDAETSNPKPQKSFLNLTTPITHLQFNHDSQILAISSSQKADAFRLVCSKISFSSSFFFLLFFITLHI
jgi:hypothetical protein